MNLKFVVLLMATAILGSLSGCVTSKPLYTSTGQKGFAISCSGHRNTWGDCLAQAGNDCTTQGFTVLSRNGNAVPIEFHNASENREVKAKLFSYKENDQTYETNLHTISIHRTMVVMCGHPGSVSSPPLQ